MTMKRTPPPRLEQLEDRLTPSTLTVSFVPDGTQIGSGLSHLFADLNSAYTPAVWQQNVLNMLQGAASQYGVTLQVVADDGASMNGSAPQDGQLRIAAVDQAFQTGGPGMPIPGGGDLIVESQVTFGVGLGLTGPGGAPPSAPAQPPVNNAPPGTVAPNTPPSATLPFILPFPTAFGNLYPTATSGPTAPISGPSGPTYTSGPSARRRRAARRPPAARPLPADPAGRPPRAARPTLPVRPTPADPALRPTRPLPAGRAARRGRDRSGLNPFPAGAGGAAAHSPPPLRFTAAPPFSSQ